MITSDIKSAESGFYLALHGLRKTAIRFRRQKRQNTKNKNLADLSARFCGGEMSRNASAVTITPSKPLGSKKSYMTFSKLRN